MRARDLGHLAQAELPGLALDRIDIDHVADFQRLRELVGTRPRAGPDAGFAQRTPSSPMVPCRAA